MSLKLIKHQCEACGAPMTIGGAQISQIVKCMYCGTEYMLYEDGLHVTAVKHLTSGTLTPIAPSTPNRTETLNHIIEFLVIAGIIAFILSGFIQVAASQFAGASPGVVALCSWLIPSFILIGVTVIFFFKLKEM